MLRNGAVRRLEPSFRDGCVTGYSKTPGDLLAQLRPPGNSRGPGKDCGGRRRQGSVPGPLTPERLFREKASDGPRQPLTGAAKRG